MVRLDNVTLTLRRGNETAAPLFKNLSCEVKGGEFVIVIGKNGVGKSTFFNLISGAVRPDSGHVFLGAQEVTSLSEPARAGLIARVFQNPERGTLGSMTLFENLAFAFRRGKRRGLSLCLTRHRRAFFQEKLSLLNQGLETRLDDMVSTLSGGQRQVLSVIMAILRPSEILLLDEITAALDPKTAEAVMKLTADLVCQEGRTTLMITHNMTHALHYGDRRLLLEEGQLTENFSTTGIYP